MSNDQFDSLREAFIFEARERIDHIQEILLVMEDIPSDARTELLNEVKRELHTLKGNSGMMGFRELQVLSHSLEDRIADMDAASIKVDDVLVGLDQLRDLLHQTERGEKPKERVLENQDTGMGSIRVPFRSLDMLMDSLAEMVIFRNRLTEAVLRGRTTLNTEDAWDEVEKSQEDLGKTLTIIQNHIMRLRMVPLRTLFGSLNRIVHDESLREEKQVRLQTSGGDTPMDKALLEVANEALGHLVRNAVIHGIEKPEIRAAKGKQRAGNVQISAVTRSNEVQIDVKDDGRGIDKAALIASAAEKGHDVSGEDVFGLLFMPGISTREESDIGAGRGMGLSAAMKAIQKLGGRFEVFSEPDHGTLFRLHLPLSVSITRALLVRADNELYALPLTAVVESFRFAGDSAHQINNAGVFRWRRKVITLLDTGLIFGTSRRIRDGGYVIVMEVDAKFRGLVIDDILGIREIVVKGLDQVVGSPPGVSGSTILGDGRVILILDPPGLMTVKPFVEHVL